MTFPDRPALVPLPRQVDWGAGTFRLDADACIVTPADPVARSVAEHLAGELVPAFGRQLPVATSARISRRVNPASRQSWINATRSALATA